MGTQITCEWCGLEVDDGEHDMFACAIVLKTQRDAARLAVELEQSARQQATRALESLQRLLREEVIDWREQASAEENCQRSGGNPKGALAYRNCADDLEALLRDEPDAKGTPR